MLRRITPLTLLLGLALVGCKKKDDDEGDSGDNDPTEYTIKVKEPAVGMTARGNLKIDMKVNVEEGSRSQEVARIDQDITFSETILEKPAGAKKPTKSKVRVEKWDNRSRVEGIANPGVPENLTGRTVLFTKIGGEYQFLAEDGGPI